MMILLFLTLFHFSVFSLQPPTFSLNMLWSAGGCASQCEGAQYTSPTYINTGTQELILGSARNIYAIDANTGVEVWSVTHLPPPNDATEIGAVHPSLAVIQDTGGEYFVVSGNVEGWVCKYRATTGENMFCHLVEVTYGGYASNDIGMIRSISTGKIKAGEGDDSTYIVVAVCCNSREDDLLYILNEDGSFLSSHPRPIDEGRCHSVGSQNIALFDLTGDSNLEIMMPCDNSRVFVFDHNGDPLPLHSDFSADTICPEQTWFCSTNWKQYDIEKKGWPDPDEEAAIGWDLQRTNHHFNAVSPFRDRNNVAAIAKTASMYYYFRPNQNGLDSSHYGLFLTLADKRRYSDNWFYPKEIAPPLTGCFDCSTAFWCFPHIAVADIDADGEKELVWSGSDGQLHVHWVDTGTEKHFWPYEISKTLNYRFSSEPAIFYCPVEGSVIVVSSWEKRDNLAPGKLHFLNVYGQQLLEINLPSDAGRSDGSLPAPTLWKAANGRIMMSLQTKYSGNVGYELLYSEQCKILWQTGRGSFKRDGVDDLGNSADHMPPLFTILELGIMITFPVIFVVVFIIVIGVIFLVAFLPLLFSCGKKTSEKGKDVKGKKKEKEVKGKKKGKKIKQKKNSSKK